MEVTASCLIVDDKRSDGICTKPKDKTVLLTVNVTGKGTLKAVELYGTDRTIPDIVNDVKALSDKVAALEQRPNPRFEAVGIPGSDHCQIIQDFQVCWGSADENSDKYAEVSHAFTFANAFLGDPFITFSTTGYVASNKDYQEYAPFQQDVSSVGASVKGLEVRGRSGGISKVTVSYIAIGKPHS